MSKHTGQSAMILAYVAANQDASIHQEFGVTAFDIAKALELNLRQVPKRISELVQAGKLVQKHHYEDTFPATVTVNKREYTLYLTPKFAGETGWGTKALPLAKTTRVSKAKTEKVAAINAGITNFVEQAGMLPA